MYNVLYIPKLGINILSTNRLRSISIFGLDTISIFRDKKYTIKEQKDTLYTTKTNILYPRRLSNTRYQNKVINKPKNRIFLSKDNSLYNKRSDKIL